MQTMLQSSSTAGSFAEDDQRHRLHSHNQLPQQQQKQQQQQQLHEPLIESSTQSFSFDEEELVDDDDPSILESMLAKAKELANEIKDTCGSSSSATDRSVGSHKSATATTTTSDKIDPAVVPHSIDVTGENATVCSSVGYGTVYSRDNARDNKLASVDVRSHGSFPKGKFV